MKKPRARAPRTQPRMIARCVWELGLDDEDVPNIGDDVKLGDGVLDED